MKKMMTLMVMLTISMTMFAKDIKTVVFTTQPQMHCENCENKIKGNLKFEKGVKEIQTNVEAQKVTVKYDADKTTPTKLAEGFSKFGYKATVVNNDPAAPATCGKKMGSCCKQEGQGSCCKQSGDKAKGEQSCCKQSQK